MKKYLILFLSILIFSSCTRLAINTANSKAAKNEFYQGILELDNSVRKDTENKELFESYENIFNRGKSYYNSTDEIRELFLMIFLIASFVFSSTVLCLILVIISFSDESSIFSSTI